MKTKLVLVALMLTAICLNAQQLQILDRFNGNALLNNSTITVFNSEFEVPDLTHYFTMKNNTDQTLAVFLRKTVNYYADSTSDYYCFGIRCWPGDDSTNVADSIPPGGEDYTFASHVTHFRRFDMPQPMLPHGISSITYTIYDKTTFPEPVEATVTVIYDHTGVGIDEAGRQGGMEAWSGMRVFPNPAPDWLIIETDKLQTGNAVMTIFDRMGRQVENKAVLLENGNYRLFVGNYAPGLYIGKITSGSGKASSFRFQVAR